MLFLRKKNKDGERSSPSPYSYSIHENSLKEWIIVFDYLCILPFARSEAILFSFKVFFIRQGEGTQAINSQAYKPISMKDTKEHKEKTQ